ncbi:MAG: aminomethyl-transferring glycine dehydrogenase [Gemmatimonadetes bacterium]|nr:aminomethyl-transferring glycine dehydrogenase [Gemmatimonadota bacterium]
MTTNHRTPDRDSGFQRRHIGPGPAEQERMLQRTGFDSLEALIAATIPDNIRFRGRMDLPEPIGEADALAELHGIAARNRVFRSYIGMGYYGCITPPVIQRKVQENPAWYTAYTPYQPEISQGRLEALLNFQTVCIDLTGLPIASASLLDEGTAAAEAMAMAHAIAPGKERRTFLVSELCHPQTIEVVRTRARVRQWDVVVGDHRSFSFDERTFGVLLQYPATDGSIHDYRAVIEKAHAAGALATVASDLLALTLLTPPGEFGADMAIGSSQRFGIPMGFGGPHAAFFTCRDDYKRFLPGRIIGISRDSRGKPALRMALQTREQHIRREKATSNICTSQVLLAVLASFYALYHGPAGLRAIAERVHQRATTLAAALRALGYQLADTPFFDTVCVRVGPDRDRILAAARTREINLRAYGADSITVAFDETVSTGDVTDVIAAFVPAGQPAPVAASPEQDLDLGRGRFARTSGYLQHPVFGAYHSETELLRYIHRLESRDVSLVHSMIALGSCTMKLNAAAEMLPISWPEFAALHPFAPLDQAEGYQELFRQLEKWLAEITGFPAVSLQPNAGSQGEYTGLSVIRAFHEDRGQAQRDVCLIPHSAHGTNPASAVMAGFTVVVVKTDDQGNIDIADLRARAEHYADRLGAIMITYPSTHGIFEEGVRTICGIVHEHGGQVYIDGANMNAMVGLCRPADIGGDVCHLNLHKTFSLPHGGGGPGMGPIAVARHLAPFLPGHPVQPVGGERASGPVAAGPWGSPSILPISWMYIRMIGAEGLTQATRVAILNANYVATRVRDVFPILYTGRNGTVAHECIVDTRITKHVTGVDGADIAKRLMDYGFHAPTVSFPVAGTLMVEPTESESMAELDRFCEALSAIREEIREIELGIADRVDNLLKHAPHTADIVAADEWHRPYSRERAAFPAPWTREFKVWPAVGLIESAAGARNLVCACAPTEEYAAV